ncbi:MAG: 3-hydroxyacyl-CoA dehydrogenase family protein, partial [Phycisphaerae bacterium]
MDKTVAVIGTGTMGRGIAQVFAQSGYDVYMHDAVPAALESAKGQIKKLLDRAVEKGRMAGEDAVAILERVHPVLSLSDIGLNPLVVEAITENPKIKTEVLKAAQSHVADDGILATNTSSISITQLAAETERPERFIGMHFFNPVPVMKLVEVVRGLQT